MKKKSNRKRHVGSNYARLRRAQRKANDNRVGGHFQPDSTMGKLYEALSDGRKKSFNKLRPLARGKDFSGRLFNLERIGRLSGDFDVKRDLDSETVQMRIRRGMKKGPQRASARRAA